MHTEIEQFLVQLYRPLHPVFEPLKEQIEVLRRLDDGLDIVLIARCGWGKSLIFQAFSLLPTQHNSITIIISPLKAVEEDQCSDTKALQGARPCVINGENNTFELRRAIAEGCYTHIWMSPEIALGKDMHMVFGHEIFRSRIKLLAVDELHCVASDQWGLFRADFQMLGTLRARLPDQVVCFGTTATLTTVAWQEICQCVGFKPTTYTITTSIDRPNVFIFAEAVTNTMSEIQHRIILFIWSIFKSTQVIPKAVFYVRTVAATTNLRRTICKWLCKAGMAKAEAFRTVREFHGQLTDATRYEIFDGFKKGYHRVICATTAFGFGVNPPDAMIIVQEGRTNPVEAWQKGGRAARSIPQGYFFYVNTILEPYATCLLAHLPCDHFK